MRTCLQTSVNFSYFALHFHEHPTTTFFYVQRIDNKKIRERINVDDDKKKRRLKMRESEHFSK